MSDLRNMPAPGGEEQTVPAAILRRMRFYRVRHRVYTGLLVFVVAAGLPVVGLPSLRHRLTDRIRALRVAMAGGYAQTVALDVGENSEPFPAEYEHRAARPNYPQLPAYMNTISGQPVNVGRVYPAPEKKRARAAETQSAQVATPESKTQPQPQLAQQEQPAQQLDAVSEDAEPVYRQGKLEQEVYDVLLKADANLVGLIQGSNASLRFKSWDVAQRADDLYWVRVTFSQMPAKTDMECIWQVQLLSKQVMPLNFNAKSLPRS